MIPGYELVLPPGWEPMSLPDATEFGSDVEAASVADALARLSDIYAWHTELDGVNVGASLAVTLVRRAPKSEDVTIASDLGVDVDTWLSTLDTEAPLLCALRDRKESVGGREFAFRDWFFFVPRGDSVYAVLLFTSANTALWPGFDSLFRAIASTLRFT